MVGRILDAAGGSVKGKTISILGLTFKPNTDDMREAPSLVIIDGLQALGANIRVFDPEGMEEAQKYLRDVTYCSGVYECLDGADMAVIITEWDQFRALDLERVGNCLKDRLLVDLRNIYPLDEVAGKGLHYFSIGRGAIRWVAAETGK